MAILYPFQTFAFSSSEKKKLLCAFPISIKLQQQQQQQCQQLKLGIHRFSPRRYIISASASSSDNSRVEKKVKARKNVKSDTELCNDLREFVSMVGLPEGHVPSFKDLMQHGRKDLANVVRRRGYKRITELLTISTNVANRETSDKHQDSNSSCETAPDKEVNELDEGVISPNEVSTNAQSNANGVPPLISDTQSSIESSTSLSLQDKAAKFIRDGELDTVEDIGYGNLTMDPGHEDERCTESLNEIQAKSPFNAESKKYEASGNHSTSKMNINAMTSELVAPFATEYSIERDKFSSAEGLNRDHSDKDLHTEASEKDNQVEINHLKLMLHQKELELFQLRGEIDKEKLALSTLQAKVEKECGKSQEINVAKDEELFSAEESLSGLKEVPVEFWGSCETVEVAGSFNGWHHQIKMDPHPSTTINPTGSRKSRLWSTVLWLYPGIYEIKFIVDGHWRIDPQRESVTKGSIQNNILRVDR